MAPCNECRSSARQLVTSLFTSNIEAIKSFKCLWNIKFVCKVFIRAWYQHSSYSISEHAHAISKQLGNMFLNNHAIVCSFLTLTSLRVDREIKRTRCYLSFSSKSSLSGISAFFPKTFVPVSVIQLQNGSVECNLDCRPVLGKCMFTNLLWVNLCWMKLAGRQLGLDVINRPGCELTNGDPLGRSASSLCCHLVHWCHWATPIQMSYSALQSFLTCLSLNSDLFTLQQLLENQSFDILTKMLSNQNHPQQNNMY